MRWGQSRQLALHRGVDQPTGDLHVARGRAAGDAGPGVLIPEAGQLRAQLDRSIQPRELLANMPLERRGDSPPGPILGDGAAFGMVLGQLTRRLPLHDLAHESAPRRLNVVGEALRLCSNLRRQAIKPFAWLEDDLLGRRKPRDRMPANDCRPITADRLRIHRSRHDHFEPCFLRRGLQLDARMANDPSPAGHARAQYNVLNGYPMIDFLVHQPVEHARRQAQYNPVVGLLPRLVFALR